MPIRTILSSAALHTLATDETEVPTCPQCATFSFSTAKWETSSDWKLESAVCENGHVVAAKDLKYKPIKDVAFDGLFEAPEPENPEEDTGISFSDQFVETSDRDAVILASVWFDNILGGIIRQFSIDGSRIDKELLEDGNKPLATFSAKTKVCYLFGLINHEEFAALNILRGIRNDFAHELLEKSSSLEDDHYPERIRSMAQELKLTINSGDSPREIFDSAINILYNSLVDKFYIARKTSGMPLNARGKK